MESLFDYKDTLSKIKIVFGIIIIAFLFIIMMLFVTMKNLRNISYNSDQILNLIKNNIGQ